MVNAGNSYKSKSLDPWSLEPSLVSYLSRYAFRKSLASGALNPKGCQGSLLRQAAPSIASQLYLRLNLLSTNITMVGFRARLSPRHSTVPAWCSPWTPDWRKQMKVQTQWRDQVQPACGQHAPAGRQVGATNHSFIDKLSNFLSHRHRARFKDMPESVFFPQTQSNLRFYAIKIIKLACGYWINDSESRVPRR